MTLRVTNERQESATLTARGRTGRLHALEVIGERGWILDDRHLGHVDDRVGRRGYDAGQERRELVSPSASLNDDGLPDRVPDLPRVHALAAGLEEHGEGQDEEEEPGADEPGQDVAALIVGGPNLGQ